MSGFGMAPVFAPSARAVLGAVRAEQAGQASGATNAVREVGGGLGITVPPAGPLAPRRAPRRAPGLAHELPPLPRAKEQYRHVPRARVPSP